MVRQHNCQDVGHTSIVSNGFEGHPEGSLQYLHAHCLVKVFQLVLDGIKCFAGIQQRHTTACGTPHNTDLVSAAAYLIVHAALVIWLRQYNHTHVFDCTELIACHTQDKLQLCLVKLGVSQGR